MSSFEVVPYDESWPRVYDQEAEILRNILKDNLAKIHHFGSTAIPGISAKPVIDIIAVVHDAMKVEAQALEKLGYKMGFGIGMPFHVYFSTRDKHLHIWEVGHPVITQHIMFRDYLRAHPGTVNQYQMLKNELLQKFKDDKRSYTKGKDQFIRSIIEKTGFNGRYLTSIMHDFEWENYHRIFKTEICEHWGIEYGCNHNSLSDSNYRRFIYTNGVNILGIIVIELRPNNDALLRVLAIDKPYQKMGYDSEILLLTERWVKQQGVKLLLLHSRVGVEGFDE